MSTDAHTDDTSSAHRDEVRRRHGGPRRPRALLPGRAPTVFDGLAAFASCPRPVRQQLAAHTDVLRPAPGTVLARQGTTAREVVVIVTGEVAIERDGHVAPPLGAGRSFGGDEVLTGAPHRCTIVAAAGVELRVINGPAFLAAAPHLPSLAGQGRWPSRAAGSSSRLEMPSLR